MKTKIVCTYNDSGIFNQVINQNENLLNTDIIEFDNSSSNTPITENYNKFIKEIVEKSSENFWCVFIHQDFGIMENIDEYLKKLSPAAIYGAIGVKVFNGLFYGKCPATKKFKFKKRISLTFGRILQGIEGNKFKKHGRRLPQNINVDALDCCCIIMHSLLIKKHNLYFDENLRFHMYAEDLCYRAKKEYKIPVKVAQMRCFHLGQGTLNKDFYESTEYLKEKFKIDYIPSTCPN